MTSIVPAIAAPLEEPTLAEEPVVPRKLPPMGAIEFAVEHAFRRFFFGIRLLLLWMIVLVPYVAGAYILLFKETPPDPENLTAEQIWALAVFAVFVLLASISIAVNWHRRILDGTSPQSFGWIRLNGVVWRYLGRLVLILVFVGIIGALGFVIFTRVPAVLVAEIGPAGDLVAKAAAIIVWIITWFVWLRLMSALPAVSTGNAGYGLPAAWKITRKNTMRYLAFTFWMVFVLDLAGAIGAGLNFLVKAMPGNQLVEIAAFAASGIISLWSFFFLLTIPAAHYRFFGEKKDFAEGG